MNSATRRQSSCERSGWGGNISGLLTNVGRNGEASSAVLRASGPIRPSAYCALCQRRHQAVGFGEQAEVMIGVAEGQVDGGDALEVVADLVLHGHADAAVPLDRALADD